jgi:hypothetical protein
MQKILFAIALCILFSLPLCAAEYPAAEIFGGYQFIHNEDLNFNGFTAAVEGNVNKTLGIVGDFGYGQGSGPVARTGGTYNIDDTFFSFMGGPRVGYRASKARVFGEVLFGGGRYDYTAKSGSTTVETKTGTNFMIAFGGGLDIKASKRISIRPAQFDVIRLNGDLAWETDYRFSAGIVFTLGSRGK